MLDVTRSVVVGPPDPSAQERQAICMLIEEVEKRIQIRWEQRKRASPEATQGGRLTLRWFREPGHAGSGTGCGVSEVWLITDSGCRP